MSLLPLLRDTEEHDDDAACGFACSDVALVVRYGNFAIVGCSTLLALVVTSNLFGLAPPLTAELCTFEAYAGGFLLASGTHPSATTYRRYAWNLHMVLCIGLLALSVHALVFYPFIEPPAPAMMCIFGHTLLCTAVYSRPISV